MAKLEDIKRECRLGGILPNQFVEIRDVKWHGSNMMEITYRDENGRSFSELLSRDNEEELEVKSTSQVWDFKADGSLLRLVAEAHRIRLGYLFDPYMAVHTSIVEPLPHQITAVYQDMLQRQPLRFLLADDPGAGKTIMAGLLVKELISRGDVKRCLIVCPGNLADQWQDELYTKFHLDFELINREKLNSSVTGNVFEEVQLGIARLDHLSRNEELQAKIEKCDWDLIICDEAHKMSATYFGGEIKYTKRYNLGKLLSRQSRHFLLMTATPHNGKEHDFQLFLALIDGDRFEGKFRDGVHTIDPSDIMRRMIKEKLIRFDGTPLFPERRAYTTNYKLSDAEAKLYSLVSEYVREEFNRAERIGNEGRKGTVGFALTVLQRRLASSPEAIYQSLKRRRERLEKRLKEEELNRRGLGLRLADDPELARFTMDDIEDLEDAPDDEFETQEEMIMDRATTAQTIEELKAEIKILRNLEKEARAVIASGTDKKWEELSKILNETPEMFGLDRSRRKMVIFTEHKDTLNYLERRIGTMIGSGSIVIIHGGIGREERKKAEVAFTQDKDITVLIATDAAGEGINLQRAHLMINYDLPWNPNRLEQRFGRIHRIGQTEVCHLWNLVASETREGMVFQRLCEKIEQETQSLNGQVFDVLGRAFEGTSLRELLIEAIRYGEQEDVKKRIHEVIDHNLDHTHLRQLVEDEALVNDVIDMTKLQKIKQSMERAEARRLQPHFIREFFIAAFNRLGGTIRPRETGRYEINHVPAIIRNRDRQIGTREVVGKKYQRVTFHKDLIHIQGKPEAAFVCPGHPLLNAVNDLILEQHRSLLKQGAILVDPQDTNEEMRALFFMEFSIQNAQFRKDGGRGIASKQMIFVEATADGKCRQAGYAPYLDYRPVVADELNLLEPELAKAPSGSELESSAVSYAIEQVINSHFEEVRSYNDERIKKTMLAVKDRLTKEINYWDHRAQELKEQEAAGKNVRLSWTQATQRADSLQTRLQARMDELQQSLRLSSTPPVVIGGALVIPEGLLSRLKGERTQACSLFARETKRVENIAMRTVMEVERDLGYKPKDVSDQKLGWDIESYDPKGGHLRFIEVKGRTKGNQTITVTKNEILASLNKPVNFILAICLVHPTEDSTRIDLWQQMQESKEYKDEVDLVYYVLTPFEREPGFAEVSINFSLNDLIQKGKKIDI